MSVGTLRGEGQMARRRPYLAPLAVVLAALLSLEPASAKSVETVISTDKHANLPGLSRRERAG